MSALSPAYKVGLAARNRLTDARDEVHRLRDHLPDDKRRDLITLYNQLCSVQGTLEALLEDVPTTIPDDGEQVQSYPNGSRDVNIYLPSAAVPLCLPVTKMAWTSEDGQQLVSLQLRLTDHHTVASALAPTEQGARKQLMLRVILALQLQHDVILGKVPGLPQLPKCYDPVLHPEE